MSHAIANIARRLALLTTLSLTLGSATLATANETGFRYQSSQNTAVAIRLATEGNPALISFYSEGANGLRLLENVFTDTDGAFSGELRLPAHLQQVVMIIRGDERQDTLTLTISNQTLAYAE